MKKLNNGPKPGQIRTFVLTTPLLCLLAITSCSQEKETEDTGTTMSYVEEMVARIDTTVDAQFVYDYEQSKFVPPEGKTLLIMGQSVDRINEYQEHFSEQPGPAGWAAYWGIPEFSGVLEASKNENGATQHHQMLVDKFPNTVVQSALWMVGKWDVAKKAGKGEYDEVIKQYSAWAKSVNRPIYLRIGYEFDGPHNELEPKEYVKAYKRIVDLIRAENVKNIAFVWHSYAAKSYKDYPLLDWYPGDDYVDWVGISVFGHAYGKDFGPQCNDVLDFARQHRKPVMIAESNPIHGIIPENSEVWDQWFVNYFNFIYKKNIKAISFINENWPETGIEGISDWQDGRLYNNKKISEAWFQETNKEHYLKQSPELFEELGFTKQ